MDKDKDALDLRHVVGYNKYNRMLLLTQSLLSSRQVNSCLSKIPYYHACSILGFGQELTDQVGHGLPSHLFNANLHRKENPQLAAQNSFDPSGKKRDRVCTAQSCNDMFDACPSLVHACVHHHKADQVRIRPTCQSRAAVLRKRSMIQLHFGS